MLELGLLIFFGGMAFRISKMLRDEAITLEIHDLSRTLQVRVFLFPVGPSALLYGAFYAPLALAAVGALLCYVPVLLIARRQSSKLQTAGTDRVAKAESAISEEFCVALVGVIFVVAVVAITWGAKCVAPGV